MLRSALAFLMILLAAPASYAGSRPGGGFHGGFHGGGFHSGGHNGGGGLHGGAVSAFRPNDGRVRGFRGGFGLGYGYNCGLTFDCGVYHSGYGYNYGNGLGGGPGNVASNSEGYSGGYVPDPEGADIPPVNFPTSCWVRRAGYDPSGAYVGPILINLCRPSDSVTVTRRDARAQTPPNRGKGTGQPAPANRPGAPQSNL
jgi:hypothetical protein